MNKFNEVEFFLRPITVSMPLVSWLALAWVAIAIGLMLAGVI